MKLRIREERNKRGLTLQEVAERIGTTKGYLSEMERGARNVNSKWLGKISEALGCAPFELIDDESIPEDIFGHVRDLLELSDGDRSSVIRHAKVLRMQQNEPAD